MALRGIAFCSHHETGSEQGLGHGPARTECVRIFAAQRDEAMKGPSSLFLLPSRTATHLAMMSARLMPLLCADSWIGHVRRRHGRRRDADRHLRRPEEAPNHR